METWTSDFVSGLTSFGFQPKLRARRSDAEAASNRPAGLIALLLALALLAAACGSDDSESGSDADAPSSAEAEDTDGDDSDADDDAMEEDAEAMEDEDAMEDDEAMEETSFPINVETSSGTVTIESRPERIVSLSPTATEILFAIGAGEQVIAVDLFSNFPEEAPEPSLDGYTPDLEAILSNEPDLVVSTGLPEDITAGLTENGVVVMFNPAAASFDDTYDQVAQLGEATGNIDQAAKVNADIRSGIESVVESLPESDEPIRVFHEIDDSFYTATSASFIGQVYQAMGFENVADPYDDGFGFPLIDGETIIAADPTLIVFTDQMSYTAEDIAARPGWGDTTAVKNGNIVQVNADIASRWGPRIVDFMVEIASAVLVDA